MDELAQRMFERARAAADADGRLSPPVFVEWDVWPFEGQTRVKPLAAPKVPEKVRAGEGDQPCPSCGTADGVLWRNERWMLAGSDEPTGLPLVAWISPIEHLDLADLDAGMAAELGTLTVAATRVLERCEGIGRVHVLRWGDGGSHLHVLLQARPYGLPQVRGTFVTIWDDILPPFPRDEWRAWQDRLVEGLLAEVGGTGP